MSAAGSKTYIVMIGSGRRRTIGKTTIITLAEARTEAKRILAEMTLGIGGETSIIKFETAADAFLKENFQDRKPRTAAEAKRRITKHFMPAFGTKLLSKISDRDVAFQLAKIASRPCEQLHAFRALRAMLRWCTRPPRRYIPHSPLEGYAAPGRDRKRTRVLKDDELARIWHACEGEYGDMVRLLILWGTRNGETCRLKRVWIEDDVLTIPGEFTKNGRAHAIPLLPMAQRILDQQPSRGSYYFPAPFDDDTHFKDGSWGKYKLEIEKRSGVSDWQLRDIRRTFRSNMARMGIYREVAEVLLNHVTGASRNELDEIYNRYDFLDEKRSALAKWEERLSRIAAIENPRMVAA